MFGKSGGGKRDYRQVNLDEFSDDDSDHDINGAAENGHSGGGGDRVQQQLQRQDEGLEMLSQSAERLGKMSMSISEELGQQNKMLDEMDVDLDEADENLNIVTRKTKDFIEKQAGGTKNFLIILILSVVTFVLLMLILYF